MRLIPRQYQLLALVSVILIGGFLATSVAGYLSSRDAIEQAVESQALPLTSDNVYSEIQKAVLQPVVISSLMAHDAFVLDWMARGEPDSAPIMRYLTALQQEYGTVASFLVSERSRNYYYPGGILKTVHEDDPRDAWFFQTRDLATPYRTEVDTDLANRGRMTIFINYRLVGAGGAFLGVAGVGLTVDTMAALIDRYRARFHRNIYFVDPSGAIVLTGKTAPQQRGSILTMAGVNAIAGKILNHSIAPTELRYGKRNALMMVNSRFIPELGWYLVVEQDLSSDMQALQRVFLINLAISGAVTLLVLAITLWIVGRHQRKLEARASTDALTGLLNRQALKILFRKSIAASKRSGQPLSAILFDIDFFKRVNDSHGHLAGDAVIRGVAQVSAGAVRESDVVTRWGGEEFMILLADCAQEQAWQVAEALRLAVAGHAFDLPPDTGAITISLGVAEYAPGESEADFFARADAALYQAKHEGRNRSIRAQMPGAPLSA